MPRYRFVPFIAILFLAGCVTTPPPKPPMVQPKHISYGPFEGDEISFFQPHIRHEFSRESPLGKATKGLESRFVEEDNKNAGMQVRVRRSGDIFVYRVMMRLPERRMRRLGTDDDIYGVRLHLERKNQPVSTLRLGFVNMAELNRTRTPEGWVLDSGWIWSPGDRDHMVDELDKDEGKLRRRLDGDWRYFEGRMAKNKGRWIRLARKGARCTWGCKNGVSLHWVKPEEMDKRAWSAPKGYGPSVRDRLAARTFGRDALAALVDGEATYGRAFAGLIAKKKARAEVLKWLDENLVPVSPHGLLKRRCKGPVNISRDSVKKLNRYAACLKRFRKEFDVAPFEAVYQQARDIMDAWADLDGRYYSSSLFPGDRFVDGYPLVHPEDVETAFDLIHAFVTNPKGGSRARAAKARAERVRLRRERQRRAREVARSGGSGDTTAWNFIAGQMRQNRQILNALQPPAVTPRTRTTTTTTTTRTKTVTRTTTRRSVTSRASRRQEAALPPLMNETYWVVLAGGGGDPTGACENFLTGTLKPGDTSRVVCEYAGKGGLAWIHKYYCDAPEGEPKVEAYSADGPNAKPILTFYLRGLTRAQRDRLYRMHRDDKRLRSSRHVDTTEIMAYRHIEDTWLKARDSQGRQLVFRSDAELRGSVVKHCGGGGTAAWETGADRRVDPL